MRILIASDKFKGSMTAGAACGAIARGVREVFPGAEVVTVPVADGGEGTARAVFDAVGGEWVEATVADPLGRDVVAGYAMADIDGRRTAVMEMSEASGLWRLERETTDPHRASTFGTGQMMRDARERGAEKILIGIGGSATNDGGSGMAQALGYRFFDEKRVCLGEMPVGLEGVTVIEKPLEEDFGEIVVASDVTNPLLGPNGATRVYGGQKGARPEDMDFLEARLAHLAAVVRQSLGCDFAEAAGAGAAGGLGFGLLSFCGASLEPGFELVARAVGLAEEIPGADLVITGEGKIDGQTAQGKAPAGVAAWASREGVPAAAFGGLVPDEDRPGLEQVFSGVFSIREAFPGVPLGECLVRGEELLEETVKKSAQRLKKVLHGR